MQLRTYAVISRSEDGNQCDGLYATRREAQHHIFHAKCEHVAGLIGAGVTAEDYHPGMGYYASVVRLRARQAKRSEWNRPWQVNPRRKLMIRRRELLNRFHAWLETLEGQAWEREQYYE